MHVEPLENGDYTVVFDFYVFTAEQPEFMERQNPLGIVPTGEIFSLDEIVSKYPKVPMTEYLWHAVQQPCTSCDDEGAGDILLGVSQEPAYPLAVLRRKKQPVELRRSKDDANRIRIDEKTYDLLERGRLFRIVEKEDRQLVHLGHGRPLYITAIESSFTFDPQEPDHPDDETVFQIAYAAARLTQLITRTYAGIASDDYNWFIGAFNVNLVTKITLDNAASMTAALIDKREKKITPR